jgi:hypothetical protein
VFTGFTEKCETGMPVACTVDGRRDLQLGHKEQFIKTGIQTNANCFFSVGMGITNLCSFFPQLWIMAGMKNRSNNNCFCLSIYKIMNHVWKLIDQCSMAGLVSDSKRKGIFTNIF